MAFRIGRRVQLEVMCPTDVLLQALERSVDASWESGGPDAKVEAKSQE